MLLFKKSTTLPYLHTYNISKSNNGRSYFFLLWQTTRRATSHDLGLRPWSYTESRFWISPCILVARESSMAKPYFGYTCNPTSQSGTRTVGLRKYRLWFDYQKRREYWDYPEDFLPDPFYFCGATDTLVLGRAFFDGLWLQEIDSRKPKTQEVLDLEKYRLPREF